MRPPGRDDTLHGCLGLMDSRTLGDENQERFPRRTARQEGTAGDQEQGNGAGEGGRYFVCLPPWLPCSLTSEHPPHPFLAPSRIKYDSFKNHSLSICVPSPKHVAWSLHG